MRNVWLAASIVLIDQATKILVLNTMYRGQSVTLVGDWFRLTFTENPGMAFGIELGHPGLVTVFSIAATVLILYYMIQIGEAYVPYRLSLGLVFGGAVGNIIDRVLYGKILYGEPLFLGRVVDFIHIDVWRGLVPDWVPLIGGHYMALFPIWNVADMSIVVGVVGIIVFQRRFHERATAGEAAEGPSGAAAAETPERAEGPSGAAAAETRERAEGPSGANATEPPIGTDGLPADGLPAQLDGEGHHARKE